MYAGLFKPRPFLFKLMFICLHPINNWLIKPSPNPTFFFFLNNPFYSNVYHYMEEK